MTNQNGLGPVFTFLCSIACCRDGLENCFRDWQATNARCRILAAVHRKLVRNEKDCLRNQIGNRFFWEPSVPTRNRFSTPTDVDPKKAMHSAIRLGKMLEQTMELVYIVVSKSACVVLPAMNINDKDEVFRMRSSLDFRYSPSQFAPVPVITLFIKFDVTEIVGMTWIDVIQRLVLFQLFTAHKAFRRLLNPWA